MNRMKIIVVSFVILLSSVGIALAGEEKEKRFEFAVDYQIGSLNTRTEYRGQKPYGDDHELNGLGLEFSARLNDRVSVGVREELNYLRKSTFFSDNPDINGRLNPNIKKRTSQYSEAFGAFSMPKLRHELVLGFAHTRYNREWDSGLQTDGLHYLSGVTISTLGMVFGAQGERDVKGLKIEYSARFYPRSARNYQNWATSMDSVYNNPDTSFGFEFRGRVIYSLTSRFGLSGGYSYRRFSTDNKNWSEYETLVEKGFTVGIKVLF